MASSSTAEPRSGNGRRRVGPTGPCQEDAASPGPDQRQLTGGPAHCRWSLSEPLEACDIQGNWYPAKIVDVKGFQVKIHFLRWKKRYDQWFDMDTDLIRPRQDSSATGTGESTESLKLELNEPVLARWTDSNFYPARITKFYKGQYCQVLFHDGYRKKVRTGALKPLPDDYQGEQMPPLTAAGPAPLPARTSTCSSPTLTGQELKHNAFTCDTCNKGFRKESLLLQHKKHYHKMELDIDEVPSLVPPGLRAPKTNRQQHLKHETTEGQASGGSADGVKLEPEPGPDAGTKRKPEATPPPPMAETPPAVKKPKQQEKEEDAGGIVVSLPVKQLTPVPSYAVSSTARKPKPNGTLPFVEPRLAMEEHENDNIEEFVKCICPLKEESGLMVQCELCLAWQHGSCVGFRCEDDVPPHGYPGRPVRSQYNSYQLNHWLKNAQRPQLQPSLFEPEKPPEPARDPHMDRLNMLMMMGEHQGEPLRSLLSTALLFGDEETKRPESWCSGESKSFALHDFSTCYDPVLLSTGSEVRPEDHDHDPFVIGGEPRPVDAEQKASPPPPPQPSAENGEADLARVRIINHLSSALYECEIKLNSLSRQIAARRGDPNQVREQYRLLNQSCELVRAKIEQVEKEIEAKLDSLYAVHTSSTTLSAASPETFGASGSVEPLPEAVVGPAESGQKPAPPPGRKQPLARLLVASAGPVNDQVATCRSKKPSMARRFLPMSLRDAEFKLELSNYCQDLNQALRLAMLSHYLNK